MSGKQTVKLLLLAACIGIAGLLTSQTSFAAPGDSKKECDKIDGYYEGSGKNATCNAALDQEQCDKYGGTFNIGRAGTQLACIIKKGAKAGGGGSTCGDYGCDTNENIEEEMKKLESNVGGDDCAGVETVLIKCDQKNGGDLEDNGIWGLLIMVLNVMAAGVGILAVGGIVYGAVMYVTAEDKAAQIQKANGIITNVVIGLIAFALMWAGLNFIVPGGVFDSSGGGGSAANTTGPSGGSGGSGGGSGGNGGGSGGSGGTTATLASIEDIKVRNMRDAAAATNENALKSGVLYRSMMLGNIGPKDAEELAEILGKNGLIIDLRTAEQAAANPDNDIPGVKNVNIPIGGVLDTAPMVTDPTRRTQLAKALKAAANAEGPVLIHCAAGKDRTGWMVAMIMYSVGASDAQVMKEYLASNEEAVDGGVKAEWLKSGLKEMRSKYGTAKGYLKGIGLSDAEIKKLNSKFGA